MSASRLAASHVLSPSLASLDGEVLFGDELTEVFFAFAGGVVGGDGEGESESDRFMSSRLT